MEQTVQIKETQTIRAAGTEGSLRDLAATEVQDPQEVRKEALAARVKGAPGVMLVASGAAVEAVRQEGQSAVIKEMRESLLQSPW